MALRIFIYLPESNDAVLNIGVENQFSAFTKSLLSSIDFIKANKNAKIYYHKDNISTFFAKWNDLDEGVYLDDSRFPIRLFLQQALEIEDNYDSLVNEKNIYLIWNLLDFYKGRMVERASLLISEAAERLFQYPGESILLLNLNEAIACDRSAILVFKDEVDLQNPRPHDPPLPNNFVHIPHASTVEELNDWLNSFEQTKQLKVSANQIQNLIDLNQTESIFKRIDTPKILGEQLHIHFKDDKHSALNIDGSWKHGGFAIPTAAMEKLREWGFILPT